MRWRPTQVGTQACAYTVLKYIQNLGHALNRALAASFHQPHANVQLITAIHLCKGLPFYGYTERMHYYLKISYVDPALRTRIASLLESGRVLDTRFQPYEAHVQFHLQWMMDYNLFGCDYMEVDEVHVRQPVPSMPYEVLSGTWLSSAEPRDAYCALEVDVMAHAIVNRRQLRATPAGRPRPRQMLADDLLVPSLRRLWVQEQLRRVQCGLDASPALPTPEPRSMAPEDMVWDASERLKAELDARLANDPSGDVPPEPALGAFVLEAFRTVELFHPRGLERIAPEDSEGRSAKMYDLEYSQGTLRNDPSSATCSAEVVPSSFPHESPMAPPPQSQSPSIAAIGSDPAPPLEPRTWNKPSHVACRVSFSSCSWVYCYAPPTARQVTSTWDTFDLPAVAYAAPHYSRSADVPAQAHTYAGRTRRLEGTSLAHLAPFAHWHGRSRPTPRGALGRVPLWEYSVRPPSAAGMHAWCAAREAQPPAPSPAASVTSTPPPASLDKAQQHMTVLGLEVVAHARGDLTPDPEHDAVVAVAYTLLEDTHDAQYTQHSGAFLVRDAAVRLAVPVHIVASELDLLHAVVDLVRAADPEILAGYDNARASWGYLAARAQSALAWDFAAELARVRRPGAGALVAGAGPRDAGLRVAGRHVLNVWRLMCAEVTLPQYTLESVAVHVLGRRLPRYAPATLGAWIAGGRPTEVARVVRYAVQRVRCAVQLLERTELLFRTAEFARIYGMDFYSVLTRGSQFRVESVLLRITKPRSFLLPSPSRAQVGQQNAIECVPLILEPRAAYYKSPVLVLDFQSLYPSMMIAYNLCYSTCLGRITPFKGTYKLGFTEHTVEPAVLRRLRRDMHVLPNGLLFARPHVRESVLARMLREVLETRVMTRHAMRTRPQDRAFVRRQTARQLSLKLLANVTYGYVGASASGRMPCVEIADAIVQSARETLEHAAAHMERTWGAEIVYGDTDSLFVHLPGRSLDDAFRIGRAMAADITQRNPEPVRLNFEKVYLPCVLVAKKRYAGRKCEPGAPPVLDAKGLEVVRRDGHAALQHMQEACLRILFDTQDLSAVKQYCQRQWARIYAGRVSPLHLVTAKEVRFGTYASLPPGAALAERRARSDRCSVPHMGERVPYLISRGAPNARLNDLAISPGDIVARPDTPLHADYYVRRTMVPALARIFHLVGADVQQWLDEMPRPRLHAARIPFAERCAVCAQRKAQGACVLRGLLTQCCARTACATRRRRRYASRARCSMRSSSSARSMSYVRHARTAGRSVRRAWRMTARWCMRGHKTTHRWQRIAPC